MLSGCAGGIYQNSKPIDREAFLEVREYRFKNASSAGEKDLTLLAGTYKAAREDAQGVYYVGPHACFRSMAVKSGWAVPSSIVNKPLASNCGIFLPADPNSPARIFKIFKGLQPPQDAELDTLPGLPADPLAVQESVAPVVQHSVPGASIAQSAVGTAIGVAIVQSLVDPSAEYYNWAFEQPADGALRRYIQATR